MADAVLVFDGECSLCNGFVAWLIRRDRAGRFAVVGSASDAGRAVLRHAGLPPELPDSTTIAWDGVRARTHSTAVFWIMARLPWPTKALAVGWLVPRPLRDAVYRAVARRRSRIQAEDPACGVPPPELRERWLAAVATVETVEGLAGREHRL